MQFDLVYIILINLILFYICSIKLNIITIKKKLIMLSFINKSTDKSTDDISNSGVNANTAVAAKAADIFAFFIWNLRVFPINFIPLSAIRFCNVGLVFYSLVLFS